MSVLDLSHIVVRFLSPHACSCDILFYIWYTSKYWISIFLDLDVFHQMKQLNHNKK